jgi:protein gp37
MGRPEYQAVVEGGHWTGHVKCLPHKLDEPLHWKKPRRVFVDSMSDLFHEDVPDEFIWDVLDIIEEASWHTFIVLTKRPERMYDVLSHPDLVCEGMYPNLWLGVSVEDQKTADERIPWLLKTPAAVRVVSVEPMLGGINLDSYLYPKIIGWQSESGPYESPIYDPDYPRVDWVICGCESGPGARPFDIAWARDLKDQCVNAGVPFFYKQGIVGGKLVHMPELDGVRWDQYPSSGV